jgi:hypothetical protein
MHATNMNIFCSIISCLCALGEYIYIYIYVHFFNTMVN